MSEESAASISATLNMEADSTETLVPIYQITQHHIPENQNLLIT
jgi:hypothetical protein